MHNGSTWRCDRVSVVGSTCIHLETIEAEEIVVSQYLRFK